MSEFINFLKVYYREVITCISCLITIISFIINGKSNNTHKKVFRLLQILPLLISEAETLFKDVNKAGVHKLTYVLNKVSELCIELNLSYDEDFWIQKVEGVLSAPQKNIKEVQNNVQKTYYKR